MTDILLPPWLKMASIGFRYMDSTGVSRPEFTGVMRTGSRGGDRLAASLEFTPQATTSADSAQERATLIAFLSSLRGKQNRAVMTNPARRLRGSFPASELVSNNTFANGTTGWAAGGGAVLTALDRVLRLTRASSTDPFATQSPSGLTQYAPYIARVMVSGAAAGEDNVGVGLNVGDAATSFGAAGALRSAVLVSRQTTGTFYLDQSSSGPIAGSYWEVSYASLARCALVDNGPNALLQSDDFTNAAWVNTRTTDAANSTAAPDGTTTADSIIEDASASSTHYIAQSVTVSSSVGDFAFTVCLRAGTRSFARVSLQESSGNHTCDVDVNLSTGAIANTSASGANWTDPRSYVANLGGGWYAVTIIGRKASAGTTISAIIFLATALGTISYTGDGASLIYAWRGTLATYQASPFLGVPTRLVQTTTTAATGTAQTGSGIHIKGLPTSTGGLLRPDDEVEIITSFGSEMKIVTATLNSDAAGLGYLQFAPPIRGVLADNAAVIVHEPFGRFIFSGDLIGWDHAPGIITSASAEFEEAA